MNILPKKRWHVRTKANIERVRRDEAKAAEEEKILQKRIQLAEQEARTALLRAKANFKSGATRFETHEDHVNLFLDIEEQGGYKPLTNKKHEDEKKKEQIKFEKNIGLLTFLGQSSQESLHEKPWYLKSHSERMDENLEDKGKKSEKRKLLADPLEDIRGYLDSSKNKSIDHPKSHKKKHKNDNTNKSSNTIEELRAKRLKREREEKERARLLLLKHNGEIPKEVPTDERKRAYNSQFNPQFARQNKLPL